MRVVLSVLAIMLVAWALAGPVQAADNGAAHKETAAVQKEQGTKAPGAPECTRPADNLSAGERTADPEWLQVPGLVYVQDTHEFLYPCYACSQNFCVHGLSWGGISCTVKDGKCTVEGQCGMGLPLP